MPSVLPTQRYPLVVRSQDTKKEAGLICTGIARSRHTNHSIPQGPHRTWIRFKRSRQVGWLIAMPIKVLLHEKNELRLRVVGESHTALQMLRERLNNNSKVEYANYFPGHPELDDPEFYIRTSGKNASEKVLKDIVSGISSEFSSISL